MAVTRTRNQGKTAFVKEQLNLNPTANVKAVNDAWSRAGMEGSISGTLVNKMRAALGLTGNISRGARKAKRSAAVGATGKHPGRRRGLAAAANGRRPAREGELLREIEVELDRLLFRVMEIESLAKVEDAIRDVRRALYVAMAR
ncbi:hypothetical protein OJF2_10770 [Aquisphaera giovannonii]|uniref:Uncharacterized protein n=1 Tax=Aquisphaera giovannonii TaxID=406548 RepID=A0A5B9VWH8_9BACT|nr:hypothetical protein [Aquisphaera giovannonii]QEH32598.1 hypothetical protein OJF2_10770 [Aquisphaera giovannonii]